MCIEKVETLYEKLGLDFELEIRNMKLDGNKQLIYLNAPDQMYKNGRIAYWIVLYSYKNSVTRSFDIGTC